MLPQSTDANELTIPVTATGAEYPAWCRTNEDRAAHDVSIAQLKGMRHTHPDTFRRVASNPKGAAMLGLSEDDKAAMASAEARRRRRALARMGQTV